jgi:hypothetical protein
VCGSLCCAALATAFIISEQIDSRTASPAAKGRCEQGSLPGSRPGRGFATPPCHWLLATGTRRIDTGRRRALEQADHLQIKQMRAFSNRKELL